MFTFPVTFGKGATPAFTPLAIPGCIGWLDASNAGSIVASGGSVSQWNDLSGNSNNATQATGALQFATGSHTLNGKNVLFSPNRSMNLPTGIAAMFAGPWSAFYVLKDVVANDGSSDYWYLGTGFGYGFFEYGAGHLLIGIANSSFGGAGINLPSNTSPHIMGTVRNGTSIVSYLDGTTSVNVTNATDATLTSAYIGSFTGATDGSGQVDFAECVYYNRAINSTEITRLENYFSTKWGVAI